MVRSGSKNGHQKDMCLKEFGHHILEKIVNYSRFNNLQDLEGLCD
jgi:hypothetical protein